MRFTEECDGEQFKQLVYLLCPVIYGQELVKVGIVLALFGGVSKKFEDDGWILPTRGSINCLVVGDPGMGKSQMLTAAEGGEQGDVLLRWFGGVRRGSHRRGHQGSNHRSVHLRGWCARALPWGRVLRRRV